MEFEDETVNAVWESGRAVPEQNPGVWRQDQCGAWLHREQYGNLHSEFGWKIVQVSPGKAEVPENLQPFHVDNEFDIANGRPDCRVTADRTDQGAGQEIEEPRNISR